MSIRPRTRIDALVSWGSGSITHGSTPKPAPATATTSEGNAASVRSTRQQALGAAGRLVPFTGRGILEFMNSKNTHHENTEGFEGDGGSDYVGAEMSPGSALHSGQLVPMRR